VEAGRPQRASEGGRRPDVESDRGVARGPGSGQPTWWSWALAYVLGVSPKLLLAPAAGLAVRIGGDRVVPGRCSPTGYFIDLRHTFATLALAAGAHTKVVQERLGHASAMRTIDLYSSVLPGLAERAAEAVDVAVFDVPAPDRL
jgi:hypothetical protein